jgi:hypothetical protein
MTVSVVFDEIYLQPYFHDNFAKGSIIRQNLSMVVNKSLYDLVYLAAGFKVAKMGKRDSNPYIIFSVP